MYLNTRYKMKIHILYLVSVFQILVSNLSHISGLDVVESILSTLLGSPGQISTSKSTSIVSKAVSGKR